MSKPAYLPIVADRYVVCVRHIFLVGVDMGGIDMRAQIRLYGDVPGDPLVDLRTVSNGNAEGLRLVDVTKDAAGVPTSHIELVINETTMEGLPYAGEVGDTTRLAWDWQITIAGRKRRLAKGEFEITGDGVTGAENAPISRPLPAGYPRQPIINVWSSAWLTFGEEQVTVKIDGVDMLAPLIQTASEAADSASADRVAAQIAASSAVAAGRYFETRLLGEQNSDNGQSFSTDDGAGSVILYRRTATGSVEIGRTITPVTLTGYAKLTGAISFRTAGDRIGVTSAAEPFAPEALYHIRNMGELTCGFRVQSYWAGSTASPYQNNDTVLLETFNDVLSDSANRSWSLSAPNGYNNIPGGVIDSGERVGIYGWAVSVHIAGRYEHRGRLASQVGARGRAGFQGKGTPATAVIDQATGVQGEVVADATGATIRSGRAGNFVSTITPGTGIVENNHALYAEASGGLVNWAFFGQAGEMFQRDRAFFGGASVSGAQSGASVTVRGGRSNGVEFGSPDPAGYGSNIGATAASGSPFLAFCAEADPGGNTFRTRGKVGHVIRDTLDGQVVFSRLTNPNAAGQTPTDDVIWRPNGGWLFIHRPRLFGAPPATATAPGEQWEIAVDDGYLYVCVADNTWKRTSLSSF